MQQTLTAKENSLWLARYLSTNGRSEQAETQMALDYDTFPLAKELPSGRQLGLRFTVQRKDPVHKLDITVSQQKPPMPRRGADMDYRVRSYNLDGEFSEFSFQGLTIRRSDITGKTLDDMQREFEKMLLETRAFLEGGWPRTNARYIC